MIPGYEGKLYLYINLHIKLAIFFYVQNDLLGSSYGGALQPAAYHIVEAAEGNPRRRGCPRQPLVVTFPMGSPPASRQFEKRVFFH